VTLETLLATLAASGIQLRGDGEELVVTGNEKALDAALVRELRAHKATLRALVRDHGGRWAPPLITPEMLPLVSLTQAHVDAVAAGVEGGARNVQDIYPLAPLQEGILFHHLLKHDGDPYLLPSLHGFERREQLDAYLAALQAVIDRHDILRTAVVWEGLPEPVQVVWRRARLAVEEVELDVEEGDPAQALWDRFDPRRTRLDVRRAPLMRAAVAHDAARGRWLLLLLKHHLISDHTTLEVMEEEVRAHLQGRAAELPPSIPFRNFVARARLGGGQAAHEDYFRALLGDVEEPTAPFGLLDVWSDGSDVESAWQWVEPALEARLRARVRALGVSAASVCHLAWGQVLARATGRVDVVFGTVLFGRMQGGEGADRAMGVFMNTLPVRVRVATEGTEASVREMHRQLAELLRHEHASLALAQRSSGVEAPAPLFTSLLNYRHNPGGSRALAAEADAGAARPLRVEDRTNYPVVLSVTDLGDRLGLLAQAPASVGAARVCALMNRALEVLVEALETSPGREIGTLDVLPRAERRRVVEEWNATDAEYPADACLHELFEAQAERTPGAAAVTFAGEELSYAGLNARANRLAHHLTARGVGPDARVAICVERGMEMVVALLAVLKAGGGYVPLDPGYPEDRLRYTLADSRPLLLLTQAALRERFADLDLPVLALDEDAPAWADLPETNPERADVGPAHLAYVIYTSGSTGQPKGVMVEHRNVARLFTATDAWFGFGTGDVWTLFHSFAFDFSVWEIWGALLYGGRLVVVPRETARSPEEFYALLCREGVTVLNQTPSAFRQLIAAQQAVGGEHALRCVVFGGEALEPATLKPWFERNDERRTRLVNMYGITETTVHVTYRPIERADTERAGPSPIGVRIPDLKTYILDARGEPVPVGVTGELYVGGAGVARGYLDRPELTAERFVRDPFSADPQARLYRTGDLGRWLADGTIEYLGRNDHQVKIRGFRIELGEIEARLAEHPGVREAVVLAREGEGAGRQLVAWYVGPAPLVVAELRAHLAARLPEYMVPAAYVHLEALPLTPNGKVDRRALPSPEGAAYARRGDEAPLGEVETAVAEIWAEVLGVEKVGRHDHFFELGGHSLLAVRLIERMRQRGLHVEVRTLFTTPILREFAAAAGAESGEVAIPPSAIPPGADAITPSMLPLVALGQPEIDRIVAEVPGGAANVQDIYPLAPLQEGILFHHLMTERHDPYLNAWMAAFDSRALLDAYLVALQAVVDRHDVLRTSVVWEGLPEPVQVVWRAAVLPVEAVALDADGGDVAERLWERFHPRRHRLDLRRAPMMRLFTAADPENGRWLLLWWYYHLLEDHTTFDVIRAEIEAHLSGRAHALPPAVPYRNYVAQARLGVSREEHERFFRGMLGDVTEPTVPFGVLEARGDGTGITDARLRVDAALARRVRERAQALGVSAASVFHLAWAQVLARVSGREDVVFGTVLFGRMRGAGAERMMGMLINTLPVRFRVGGEGAAAGVRRAHALLADLLRHEHASLALAQRCSGVAAPTPLFTSILNYRHSAPAGDAKRADAGEAEPLAGIRGIFGQERTNYPVGMSVDDLGDGFLLSAQGVAAIDPERVCAFLHQALERLVDALETAPATPLRALDVLPEAERRRVLEDWNHTEAEYPRDACVHALFEAQAARTPDAAAVVCGGEVLSYAGLNARANRLAHHLRGLGVGPDARVAICVERSPELVVGVLAVLKAGGAYVPLDPSYPVERLRYMLADSAPRVVLSQASLVARDEDLFAGIEAPVLALDAPAWEAGSAANPAPGELRAGHLAYVIYTSGSTGRPKGVMVAHRSLVNLVAAQTRTLGVDATSRVLQFASFSFDACVFEIATALCRGAALHLPPGTDLLAGEALERVVDEGRVTHVVLPPAVLPTLPEGAALASVGTMLLAGEAVTAAAVRRWAPGRRLINAYGPTEATVWSTYHDCRADEEGDPPIGVPITNARVYVLDAAGEPAPAGVEGELYLGGAGVARGYRGRPALTAQRFVPDPFGGEPGARLYRTGDLGRWRPDGVLEFLGRNDFQVKLRGFRVELGEIETRLRAHPAVREAVVLARDDGSGHPQLVAYWVGDEAAADALRRHAGERLPEYMVPAAYVRLEALPLTPSGKVDRKALPAPEGEAFARRGYEAPRGETEPALAEIWGEVLGVERVGRWDDFFELGGHSLLVVRMVSRIRQLLGAQVELGVVFRHPVLKELAEALAAAGRAELPPIERVDRGGRLPLSYAQQRLWFLEQMGELGSAYHVPSRLRLRGTLDRAALVRALDRLVARHEVLRTTFAVHGGQPEQRIAPESTRFSLVEHDLSAEAQPLDALERVMAEEAAAPFDLERGPLIRGRLARLAEDDHVLLLTMHHIVADGWSAGVLVDELGRLYGAFRAGRPDPLPALPLQYADYAAWQRRWVQDQVLEAQAAYWTRTLAGAPERIELPADHPRPRRPDHLGASVDFALDAAAAAGLKELGRRHGTTLFMTLLAGWAAVLGRLSGQDEVVVGTPTANRGRAEIEGLIGFFVNTLALRIDLSGRPTVAELLERVKARALEAQQNQDIPFEQVVERVQPARTLAHTPLFQVAFAWQNARAGELALPGLELGPVPGAERTTAKFDLSLTLGESDGRIAGSLTYATALFERETVERFAGYLARVLQQLPGDGRRVEALRLLPDPERARVVEEWNATEVPYPADAHVHEQFEAQAARTPGAVAVVFGDRRLTYAELDGRANALARRLRDQGVGPGSYVPVVMERCIEVPVAFLGVLKAGAAFVPLHPRWPAERLRAAVGELDAPVVLTAAGAAEGGLPLGRPHLSVGDAATAGPLGVRVDARAPMYAIYTSGSTGRPKGAVVAHRGVTNRFHWMTETFGAESAGALLQTVMHVYDGAVIQLLWPLTVGGRTVMPLPDTENDPLYLGRLVEDEAVTMTGFAPSIFNTLVPQLIGGRWRFAALRSFILGGEQVDREATYAFMRHVPGLRLNNVYGPTEATIGCISYRLTGDEEGRIPIGRPIANTRAYLLGPGLEPVPVGVAGEIYLGGVCVGLGYLKDGAKTAAAFVPDPFGEPGARLYRTGDLGRWRPDGTIEFLGRVDTQVKVRGFRIELGEIEARLREHPAVREAAVLARDDGGGDRRLVAYYTADAALEIERLRAHLASRLPEYMVPAAYVRLEAMPLTPNGKVDRRALPAPAEAAYARRGYEAPVGDAEAALAEVWADVLGVERVGRHDHFFDLGGHSLLAVQVLSRVREVLGVEVALPEVFERPVLADFAGALERAARAELPPIARADRGARLPLSFAQQRLWFLEQLGGTGSSYHVPVRLRLRGELDRAALVRALDRIVARHEVLRTTFRAVDGEPEQSIAPAEGCGLHLVEHDLGGLDDHEPALLRLMREEAEAPFDLARGPLIRGRLVRLAPDHHALLLTMHHVVSDAWAGGVMVRELGALYQAFRAGGDDPLPALPVQYADYAVWQRRWVEGEVLERQASYWVDRLAGAPELLALPTDRPRPPRMEHAGAAIGVELDEALTAGLKALGRRHGTTPFVTLLAAWAAVLGRLSGQGDVVVGTPTANRGRREIEGLIGFFVNTLAVRVDLSGSPTVAELLGRVKARTLEAQANQDIPFEQVVERVDPVRTHTHTPLFQVLFSWQNAAGSGLELPGLELGRLPGVERTTAKFDLSLTLGEADGRIGGGLTYATSLYDRATVERYLGYLRRVLEQMAADETLPVDRLELLPEAERRRVVEAWNAAEADYPRDACIHELFEAQVERTPDAVAVIFDDAALTYDELNRRANALAHHLRALGVGPDARVGLCVERSLEMVVGVLGVLKAGGAWVPLDPGVPDARLRYLLDDSAPAVVLAHAALSARFAGMDVPVVELGEDAPWMAASPRTNPARGALGPAHLAYLIYTSGSTGQPKGVMVAHGGVVNLVHWMKHRWAMDGGHALLQKTPLTFDVSVWELFWPLISGARLVVARPEGHRDPGYLAQAIRRERITAVAFVPSMLQLFLDHPDVAGCTTLRWVMSGGEALTGDLVRRLHERLPAAELYNRYAPTEATVNVVAWRCDPAEADAAIPIGRPRANVPLYILGGGGEPVPVGVVGELHIGGVQVARGYQGRPGLTAERFVPDPFGGGAGARLYRTGDLARWRADGAVELVGRDDFQVKLRGIRIELGEIEARLREHAGVRDTVVLAREDTPGDRRLVAYYLAGEPLDAEALRRHVGERLPEHMVPAAYVHLEALPLTPSGKLDRKALPAPEGEAYVRRGYEAPVGAVEEALAEAWSEVLGVERVGRRDDFFELGGHSLLIVKLVERMRRRGLHAEVGTLFTAPTLAQLAQVVSAQAHEVAVPPNAIPPGCEAITPAMLPLVALGQADVDRIVAGVEGGAANVQDIYPLAPLQEGILFHHLLKRDGDPYLVPTLYAFDRREELEAYLRALQAVIDRHDTLRTSMAWEGLPEPVQVVWRRARLPVEEVELAAAEADATQALWARFDPRRTRMDVRRAPLMRAAVARDAAQDRWLLVVHKHHLISDHTALEVMQEEIRAHLLGREAELPAPLPFRNYVAQARLGASRAEHEAFFRALLGDVEEPTAPFGLLDVWSDGSDDEVARERVDPALEARLRARARALGVSAASVCHVAWGQVLARTTGRGDAVFGTVLFGRMQGGEGADRAMGLFLNTLPVRVRVGAEGAEASVRAMHRQLAALLRHEHASLALAQRCSGVEAPAPLFTSILNYRHNAGVRQARSLQAEALGGMLPLRTETRTNYPVEISVDDWGEAMGVTAHVPASVGAARVCALVHRALEALVDALEASPDRPLATLDVLPEAERRRVVEAWNRTEAPFPAERCIHELFEAQAARTPGAAAVVCGGRTLTYAELNARANRLAHHLRGLGVGPDARVGICVERGMEMMVSLLAVLKAGGAYVPLDPHYPVERLRTMLADSRPAVLLTRASLLAAEAGLLDGVDVRVLDLDAPAWADQPATNPARGGLSPAQLAYVIYTSGSTGTPKGVMVPHRGVVNLVHWYTRELALSPRDAVLIATSYAFDLTQRNLFGPLATGGRLHLAAEPFDPRGILAQLREGGITLANLTSTAFHALIDAGAGDALAGMRVVVLGGEATRPEKLLELAPPRPAFVNAYGPTECSGVVTCHRLAADLSSYAGRSVPLGEPIANSRIYLLDGAGEPAPVGVVGEIHVGGVQVARGYQGRPALTAERFVPDPFGGEPGARLYRTGDLGRWLRDGTIEFAGRNDFQVKVRGFRVELGEIEARLREHPAVREAVVVAREERPGDPRLVAYWVGDPEVGVEALRRHVASRLPEYMVPAAYIHLEALPLTPTAKLDRRALPSPEGDAYARRDYEAPVGEVEEALAEIWSEVLRLERVGRWDHFFELGGHSLLIVRVVSRIRQALGVEVELATVFERPVLASLGEAILDIQLAQFDPEELARLVASLGGSAAAGEDDPETTAAATGLREDG
jgi:amino acid adenylation domain-containing protein